MKHFTQGRLFDKHWYWFDEPHDIAGASMVNFFSYVKGEYEGFKRTSTLTSIIDLSPPLEELWGRMRKKFIQKQIEQAKNRGVMAELSTDFASFRPLFRGFRSKKKLPRLSYRILEKNGILFLAEYEGRPVAGGIFIGDGENLRAWVLASRRLEGLEGRMRDIIGGANRMVIWEAITYAKENGYKFFDLGGIDPDSPDASQRSLAEFKEGFGGERREAFYYYKIYSTLLKVWMRVRPLLW